MLRVVSHSPLIIFFVCKHSVKADTDTLYLQWGNDPTIKCYLMTTWCLCLFMTPLFILQQTGLVQVLSSVNSCPTSDNQTSSQTNMTIDMNAVSSVCQFVVFFFYFFLSSSWFSFVFASYHTLLGCCEAPLRVSVRSLSCIVDTNWKKTTVLLPVKCVCRI